LYFWVAGFRRGEGYLRVQGRVDVFIETFFLFSGFFLLVDHPVEQLSFISLPFILADPVDLRYAETSSVYEPGLAGD
jgi:hypothetical protein